LPLLSERPTVYSGCCLALSRPLIAHLHTLLPPQPKLILSIGSGFGLLEALLVAEPYSSHVVGVEVEPSPNIYLPASHHHIVHGTRFLEPRAGEATTWLFIYPRRVGLVEEYMAHYGEGKVEQIIWAGPRADWDDYARCFAAWHVHVQSADKVGGRAWEIISIVSKR
ncbi:hypothetical protein BKA66DRAFT_368022, partial [Pyrenochaeta sp. MPI-SDFR-AT-0127]